MTTDDLIEKAAKAIIDVQYPSIGWRTLSEDAREFRRRQARAALAVFEEAHVRFSSPDGWFVFGSHAPYPWIGRMEFSEEKDEAGMPRWERPVAPTGDEREALAQWLHMRFAWPHSQSERTPWGNLPEHLKTGWLDLAADAPGFRRPGSPEPSGRMIDTYSDTDLRATFGLPEPEPQGEPNPYRGEK